MRAVARNTAIQQRETAARQRQEVVNRARRQKEAERARREAELTAKRQQAASEKERKQLEKQAQQEYIESRISDTDELNHQISERLSDLANILTHTLGVNDTISFSSLRISEAFPAFAPSQEIATPGQRPNRQEFIARVKPPGFLQNALGLKGKYERELKAAEDDFVQATARYHIGEAERVAKLEALRKEYDQAKASYDAKVMQRNLEITDLERAYSAGDESAVTSYVTMVLERSEYPDGFPQEFRVAYSGQSQELAVEYELPWVDAIPPVAEYRYNKSKDAIDEKPRKPSEIKTVYKDIVAATALRTIHEIIESDQGNHIHVVVFNGHVSTTDPATGKDVRPCIASVRTTREAFSDIDLARVDKQACLRNLGAKVSASPEERTPVKPVVEFDMVDKRFVEQGDVLSGLDSRPNLMDLTPSEFEALVSNLFGRMGLETKLTRSSKDGGVDAVAYDTRPVLGGKVVIQAKRYRNTVGVSAVRDLYGTLLNEGASKGIIVATSSYGPDAYEFSKDKPLELIDGGGLLYLLDQVGVQAKIVLPSE